MLKKRPPVALRGGSDGPLGALRGPSGRPHLAFGSWCALASPDAYYPAFHSTAYYYEMLDPETIAQRVRLIISFRNGTAGSISFFRYSTPTEFQ